MSEHSRAKSRVNVRLLLCWAFITTVILNVICTSGPYVHNAFKESIDLYAEFDLEPGSAIRIPPGGAGLRIPPDGYATLSDPELRVRTLEVVVNGERRLVLSREDLVRLIGPRKPENSAISVSDSGARVLSDSELEAVRKKGIFPTQSAPAR
jgi:hypothetical protein